VVANAAATGWTTQDLLDHGLPAYETSRPTFATLQIGVNDWVRGAKPDQFRANLVRVMDRMLKVLPDRRRLLLVTIPDFSVTPQGGRYARGRDAPHGISAFNAIIMAEAKRRHLPVVDIFGTSQKMGSDKTPSDGASLRQ
jgi:lysophospholipase L1-like esterase